MTRTAGTTENGVNPRRGDPPGAGETVPEGYGTHETYRAVSDACRVYRYRDLEHNLRKFGWRRARKRVLRHGALSGQWVNRGRGELRLGRGDSRCGSTTAATGSWDGRSSGSSYGPGVAEAKPLAERSVGFARGEDGGQDTGLTDRSSSS